MVFAGLRPETREFFGELAAHNNREWWRVNADRYEKDVDEPIADLVAVLEEEFGPIRRFRPYRDVRFSPDKRPYQEHVSFAAARSGGMLYAQFGAEEVRIAGGRWQPTTEELTRFRELVDDPNAVEDIEAELADCLSNGLSPDPEAVLKTAPRGYSRDHPKIGLLRNKRLSVTARLDVGTWLYDGAMVDVISRMWRSADRWNAWLQKNIPVGIDDNKTMRSRRG